MWWSRREFKTDKQALEELRRRVPDYDTVYQPVINWVMGLPSDERLEYLTVVGRGTVKEVIRLIDRWRARQL